MNVDQAILTHIQWKNRLRNHINGNEKVDPAVLAKDDQCELGKWLHGEAQKEFTSPGTLSELKVKHARFHAAAAAVARNAISCSPEQALKLLDPLTSEFGRASSDCVNALAALRTAVVSR